MMSRHTRRRRQDSCGWTLCLVTVWTVTVLLFVQAYGR